MTPGPPRRTVRTVTAVDRRGPPSGRPPHGPPFGPPFARSFDPPPALRLAGPALLVAVIQVGASFLAAKGQPEARSLDAGAVALLLVGPIALLARRRYPATALVATFAAAAVYIFTDYPLGPVFLSLIITLLNAVVRGRRAVAWSVLAAGWVLFAWVDTWFDDGPWPNWPNVAGLGAWLLVLGAGSELSRGRIDRAAQYTRARAEESRRRASEERLRIARELHDVLAHNISLINVRAGVALHLVDERPDQIDADQVRPALAAIKDASKDALGELRSVLDVLRRGEDGAAPLAPTAGLGDLDALAERARGTGLDVRVERLNGTGAAVTAGDIVDELPAGVDLAAFRVAQEALTNVVRHAGATRATVRLRRTADELEVQVDDDGRGSATAAGGQPPPSDGAGRGIAGMRERALALGGTLDAGPRPGRGFRVRARFPLRDDA
jgi:signal transduction histidine kinase